MPQPGGREHEHHVGHRAVEGLVAAARPRGQNQVQAQLLLHGVLDESTNRAALWMHMQAAFVEVLDQQLDQQVAIVSIPIGHHPLHLHVEKTVKLMLKNFKIK